MARHHFYGLFRILLFSLCIGGSLHAQILGKYKSTADRIIAKADADSVLYSSLATMCDTYGSRLSGSESLERAIDWVVQQATKEGFHVWTEPAKVPHWIRGKESLTMTAPREKSIAMLGLGGSIPTPPEGINAEVLVVRSFDELRTRSSEAKGKIVLFNAPFIEYGKTVAYRVNGASEAARYGAVGALVRSIGPASLYTPHTGVMHYNDSMAKVPTAAISIEDAELMARMTARGQTVRVHLEMEGHYGPDQDSRNIIMELKGSEKPDEIVVMGGHIDSWDVGQGAMDDGGGCFSAWHALRTIRDLGLKPKRTIRVVFWTNEEYGTRGAEAYASAHEKEKHVLGIESDEGTFTPKGFAVEGSDAALLFYQQLSPLLEGIRATRFEAGFAGADVGPLRVKKSIPLLGLVVDTTKYFWYHHTNADTMDKLNPQELNRCAAAMAIMAYLAADIDDVPMK